MQSAFVNRRDGSIRRFIEDASGRWECRRAETSLLSEINPLFSYSKKGPGSQENSLGSHRSHRTGGIEKGGAIVET
jgi:hypothetical protein